MSSIVENRKKIVVFPFIGQTVISVLCAGQSLIALTISLSPVRYIEVGIQFNLFLYGIAFILLFLLFFSLGTVLARPIVVPYICALVLNVLALINYYELKLHGTVLTHQDIRNISTAFRQLGNYSFQATLPVRCIIISFLLLQLILVYIYRRWDVFELNRKVGGITAIIMIATAYVLVYSPVAIVVDGGWSWERKYYTDSFVVGTLENIKRALRPMVKPDGYNKEELLELEFQCVSAATNKYPDIIMILNETYYDVDHLKDFELDIDVMEEYQELDAFKGYAAVPLIGGGTNASEYELLTSNSLTLLNTSTPFNDLTLEKSNSIVNYLEGLGYTTMAAHTESSANYHRGTAWNGLGFDEVYFYEDFTSLERLGNCWAATDHSAFSNFKRFYENMPESMPRFAYLLTIQNHGDWNQNDSEYDTVHIGNNNGLSEGYCQMLNEYLSGIKLTDDFIKELTMYFSKINRNVIVYMVGDHCPYLLSSLTEDDEWKDEDLKLKKRETPYFIWSNYIDDYSVLPDNSHIDLCALTPYTLKAAGLPLSPYYNQIIRLSENVSCFTKIEIDNLDGDSDIGFVNCERKKESIYSGGEDAELVRKYFYMEFNNLQKDDRLDYLFTYNSSGV